MHSYPIFMKLAGRTVLVVGDGEAAQAKLRLLTKTTARIHVLGRAQALGSLAETAQVHVEERSFRPQDLRGAALVYGATGCIGADAIIAAEARAAGVPVNIVDRPDYCDFITPAVVDRDPVCVAIATGGASPVFGRRLRAKIEAMLPPATGAVIAAAGRFRPRLKALVPDGAGRRRFWDRLFDRLGHTDWPDRDEAALTATFEQLATQETAPQGRVLLVGAGPGDPDLLTLKAHRALQQADVILYDRLVGEAVLDYARRDAERLYVGKARGAHSVPQSQIQALMIDRARKGQLVVRLKSGDPFVFGRVGEELQALQAAGVAVEVVPGVTAASGCATDAQIPLTHRDHASAVTFVTGQLQQGQAQDWRGLFGPGRTLVIYMGLSGARPIARSLIADGASPATPVAVIARGTQADEQRVYGRLADLPRLVAQEGIDSPAAIIVGEVAGLARDWPVEALARLSGNVTPFPALATA